MSTTISMNILTWTGIIFCISQSAMFSGMNLALFSIISLPIENNLPVFPPFNRSASDPFLQRIKISGKKWVIITYTNAKPLYALDADGFLRDALFKNAEITPSQYCHRPIVVEDTQLPLGSVLLRLNSLSRRSGRGVIDRDLILVWTREEKRVITGADILDRLLKGI